MKKMRDLMGTLCVPVVMFDVFKDLVMACNNIGCITKLNMNDTYSSIDVVIDGEKYLVTIMKEEKKDDTV